jgi:hypothetical protein
MTIFFSRIATFIVAAVIGVALLMLTGCADHPTAVTPTTDQDQIIRELIPRVSTDSLRTFLASINGRRTVSSPDSMAACEQVLRSALQRGNVQVDTEVVETTEYGETKAMNNLIVDLSARNDNLAPVYITGHWDSVEEGPGMDDNASACAVVYEINRLLAQTELQRPLRLVLFAFEELGMVGSAAHVAAMSIQPACVLNLDAVAFTTPTQPSWPFLAMPPAGNYLFIATRDQELQLMLDFTGVIDHYVPALPYYCMIVDNTMRDNPLLYNLTRSDHAPFWEAEIPALMLSDMADFRSDRYHTPQDDLASLDMPFLTAVTRAVLAFVIVKCL